MVMLVTRVTEMMVLMMNDDNLKTLARQKKHKHRRCAQIRLCKDLSTQNKFLHKCFCAQKLLHKRFYAQKLIHADAFTHRKINPETSQFCTHTQMPLLHSGAFTQ
jgi:hypothetical protein